MKCRPASASTPSAGCSATTSRAPAWCSATPSAPATTWPITWPPRASALALNGDLEQRERDQVLVRFANGSATILVATDVAARGLDIKELGAVINYELTYDPEVHVHRIGRTGRAGQQGLALSLYQPNEAQRVNFIEEYQQAPFPRATWPDRP